MNRYRNYAVPVASISLGLLVAAPAGAASVQKVSSWGASGVPSYVTMYLYVPDKLADKPPVVVACHSCGTPVSGYINSIAGVQQAADKNGFLIILPEATGRNCWDVGSKQSLTHDGGGDTQAVAQMVKYVLSKYNGDAARVYAMGGSSGAMMTQALMAVYPDIFRAGSARAGVPAGCWSDGFDPGQQWSNSCAGGNTNKTAQQWGDLVRSMYPGHTGHRPRVQLFHGTADATINYKNFAEAIEEWTNVLELSTTPTSKETVKTSISTYERQSWKNSCGATILDAWAGQNGSHSMAYETDAILSFFGLDKAGSPDPEPDTCGETGDAGVGEAGGAGGSGVATGSGGAGAVGAGGTRRTDGGIMGVTGGSEGHEGSGGRGAVNAAGGSSSGSETETGGSNGGNRPTAKGGGSGKGGAVGTGGAATSAGSSTSSENSAKGGSGSKGSGGTKGRGGASSQGEDSGGGSEDTEGEDTPASDGCSVAIGNHAGRSLAALPALLLALGFISRRQRRARP